MYVRSPLLAIALPLATGLAVGISGPVLESMNGQVSHAASVTLVAGWIYALLAFISGLLTGTRMRAAIMGFISLVVTVFAYYSTKAAKGDFRSVDFSDPDTTTFAWGSFLSMLLVWCFFALILGPLCGLSGHLARTGPYRLPFQLLIPAVAIGETSMRLSVEAGRQEALVGTTWSVTRFLAVAVILTLACVTTLRTWRRRSARAHS
ncbi:DUF6518 family protein [Streptomyces sp. URMC 123]|uniref:DUF6518 family protein n=1 Tax=Streptomyces sp. URMC 123 TaxID=3423403 RepID=UPI003F1BDEBA